MIKKILFVSAVLIAAVTIQSTAQTCTPDVSCIPSGQTYGICPDSATGMAPGVVGVPYSEVMSMMVPPDGTDFGYPTATITTIDIISVDNLAPGLSYTCTPAGCSFPGNTNGCILITGTPTMVWDSMIRVNAIAYATIFGVPVNLPQTNEQYRSVVTGPASVDDLKMNEFDVDQNSPNPFTAKSDIRFSSLNNTEVEFKVYNLLGAVVYSNKFKAEKGLNTITIQANSFAPGVYVYSVKNGEKTITKRMVVAGK
ncbi:MAG: T9SS type A sorting domain-containing protein [Bacteroidota bacterium]|nr:T9SS type A sorting domain-containing protein [Bacteroidota bacterium]